VPSSLSGPDFWRKSFTLRWVSQAWLSDLTLPWKAGAWLDIVTFESILTVWVASAGTATTAKAATSAPDSQAMRR